MTLVSPVITAVAAREVLDCRGLPTLQVDLTLDEAVTGTADVPTGRSTGSGWKPSLASRPTSTTWATSRTSNRSTC